MARAAKTTIIETEEILPVGGIDPEFVHLPGIFVDRIIKGTDYEKRIEVFMKIIVLFLVRIFFFLSNFVNVCI